MSYRDTYTVSRDSRPKGLLIVMQIPCCTPKRGTERCPGRITLRTVAQGDRGHLDGTFCRKMQCFVQAAASVTIGGVFDNILDQFTVSDFCDIPISECPRCSNRDGDRPSLAFGMSMSHLG